MGERGTGCDLACANAPAPTPAAGSGSPASGSSASGCGYGSGSGPVVERVRTEERVVGACKLALIQVLGMLFVHNI